MLTTDTDRHVCTGFTTPVHREFHQLAHALLVQYLERVVLQDATFVIHGQELVFRVFA